MIEELLNKRKSCREFCDKEIDNRLIDRICNLVKFGQKAGNLQSVKTKIVVEKQAKHICYLSSGMQDVVKDSPYILLIGNDDSITQQKYDDEWTNNYGCQNSCIAAQNIILLLTQYDVGSCWVGGFSKQKLTKDLSLEFTPWVMLCFGYPKHSVAKVSNYSTNKVDYCLQYHNVAVDVQGVLIYNSNQEVSLTIEESVALQVVLRDIFDKLKMQKKG